jgi:hypothetical protein
MKDLRAGILDGDLENVTREWRAGAFRLKR